MLLIGSGTVVVGDSELVVRAGAKRERAPKVCGCSLTLGEYETQIVVVFGFQDLDLSGERDHPQFVDEYFGASAQFVAA